MTATRYDRYVKDIQQRCASDAGTRSALRSGLRRRPEQAYRMHAIVARWLSENVTASEERAHYTVAALIGDQPPAARTMPTDDPTEAAVTPPPVRRRTSLGHALAELQLKQRAGKGPSDADRPGDGLTSLEQRLHLLTRQGLDGLHRHLPAMVGRLRGSQVPIDWAQLLDDLARWPVDHDRIAKRWLQDFYRSTSPINTVPVASAASEEKP